MDEKRTLVCSLRTDFVVKIELPWDFSRADAVRLKKLIDFEVEISRPKKRGVRKTKAAHSVIDEISGSKL